MTLTVRTLTLAVVVFCHTSVVRAADPVPAGVDVVATEPVGSLAMSPNARFVAWTSNDAIAVVDRLTRQRTDIPAAALHPPARRLGGHPQQVYAISDDGRYLVYRVGWSGLYGYSLTAWIDMATGVIRTIGYDDRFMPAPLVVATSPVAMSRDGLTASWIETVTTPQALTEARVMAFTPADPTPHRIGSTCLVPGSLYPSVCTSTPGVSGDGRYILYTAGSTTPEALAYYDTTTGTHDYYAGVRPRSHLLDLTPTIAPSTDGTFVATRSVLPSTDPVGVFDRSRGRLDTLAGLSPQYSATAVSDDGEVVLLAGESGVGRGAVLDRHSGLVVPFAGQELIALSADGRFVLGRYTNADGSGTDLRVTRLDADADGMLDEWEKRFGLDPTSAADGAVDSDGDGVPNLAEFAARSHPTALAAATRLFAEGAGGSFFDTTVSVFNPGETTRDVVVRFLGAEGTTASRVLRLAAHARADVGSCCVGTLEAAEIAVLVESNGPIVADRRMTWDRVTGYGSHASAGASAPATAWYFAEGATIGGLQTFFLLQNPGAIDGTASLEFLLADGTQVTRTIPVPAGRRRTMWVNQEGGRLAAAEFAAVVRTSVPMVAERALYRHAAGQLFAAGTNAMGVTAPATHWFFAEGTTRGTFDTFLLAANPSDTPVAVHATFAGIGDGGVPVSIARSYTIAPRSRLTIWVDQEDAALAAADVSTSLAASAPIVAERAMWWRAGGPEWAEGHVEFGATATATRFAIADGATVPATDTDTFVLVASPDGAPATLRVTAYASAAPPIVREFDASGARTTISMRQAFPELTGPYSLVVESLPVGGVATPIVVERAIYSHGFAAGAASQATPLPAAP